MKPITKTQLESIGRGLLKAGGGALAANGVTTDSIKQAIVGVLIALVGFVFSYFTHSDEKPGAPTPNAPIQR